MKVFILFVALLGLLITSSANAKIPIEVISTADDNVGQRLVYAVKEEIRASSTFEITLDQNKERMILSIVTLDPTIYKTGYETIYSLVILMRVNSALLPLYISHSVGSCPNDPAQIRDAANRIIASVSDATDALSKALSQMDQN